MKDLNFTKVGEEYISDSITGASAIHLHLNFDGVTEIDVDRSLDAENLGWAVCAHRRADGRYEESIVGIPEGTAVRVRCGIAPVVAKYNEEGGAA